MPKYYEKPFAENGNRQSIPDDDAGNPVSYDQGYTPAYELPKTDPDRRNIDRQPFNGILFDATDNLKFWQENGAPEIVADDGTGSPVSYPFAFVGVSGGVLYQAVVTGGTTTVPPSAEWIEYQGDFYDNSDSGLDSETVQGAIDESYGQLFSVGQTWQDVSASRSTGVVYTNSTDRPIQVAITVNSPTDNTAQLEFNINGSLFSKQLSRDATLESPTNAVFVTATIPPGDTYELVSVSGGDAILWWELRS